MLANANPPTPAVECGGAVSPHAAIATVPPGRLELMGELTGPVSWRPLNQTAANHTLAAGGLLLGKFTRSFDRLVLHSKFQSLALVGG
jgi:hypothetical protein